MLAALVAAAALLSPAPQYEARIEVIPTTFRMTSWRPGCPVHRRDLRLITLSHWGFDGKVRKGRLVVHRSYAKAVAGVFGQLFSARFPVRRIRLVEAYGSDDDRSMAADNTSAFNCRFVEGTSSWSEHAYGRAIDLNPIENPYVNGGTVSPPRGRAYLDRSQRKPGMVHDGDVVVRAFRSIGWGWGGYWRSLKDYQHFSATGR